MTSQGHGFAAAVSKFILYHLFLKFVLLPAGYYNVINSNFCVTSHVVYDDLHFSGVMKFAHRERLFDLPPVSKNQFWVLKKLSSENSATPIRVAW